MVANRIIKLKTNRKKLHKKGGYMGGAFPALRRAESGILLELLLSINPDYNVETFARRLLFPSSDTIRHNIRNYLDSNVSLNKKRRFLSRIISICGRLSTNPLFGHRMNEICNIVYEFDIPEHINNRDLQHGITDESDTDQEYGRGKRRKGGYKGGSFNQLGGMAQNAIKKIIFGIIRTSLHRMIPIVLGKLYFPDSRTIIENIQNIDRNSPVWNEYKEILNAIPDPFNRNKEIINYINEHIAGRL